MTLRSLQQHDCRPAVATRFVRAARVGPADAILEVGPGTGAITAALEVAGARIWAVERDPQRASGLRQRFAAAIDADRLRILVGDARDLHPDLPADWRVVANPPFELTSGLVRRWLLEDLPGGWPLRIDLVLQKEAAQRLCGTTRYGQSRNSVLCRLFGSPRLLTRLCRDDVQPAARVDLATWSLKRGASDLVPADLRLVDRLLERAFAGAHSVRLALRGLASKTVLERQAEEWSWNPEAHPRTVPAAGWLSLARYLRQIGKL